MNHYKYIVLSIQDMSTCELVHSLSSSVTDDIFELSKNPLQYYVRSDDMLGLLEAKEIMVAILNSIYEVNALDKTKATNENRLGYASLLKPVYIDNLAYYNGKIKAGLLEKQKMLEPNYRRNLLKVDFKY